MIASIRPLAGDDVDAYRALRLRGLAEHPEAFTSSTGEEAAKPVSWLSTRIAASPGSPANVVLGAFADDVLVGIVGLDVDPRAKVRHKGHVFGMYVPSEHARGGVGERLVAALIAHAERFPALSQLVLTVTADNLPAVRLYGRAGFLPFGREPEAVVVDGRRYDKLHMIRYLANRPNDSA
jgi:RimJ/RimL family protein N-acetyltransferase